MIIGVALAVVWRNTIRNMMAAGNPQQTSIAAGQQRRHRLIEIAYLLPTPN